MEMIELSKAGSSPSGHVLMNYKCSCGNSFIARRAHVARGEVQSCGCLLTAFNNKRNYKHGHSIRGQHSPEIDTWYRMLNRCNNDKNVSYADYGGRGIKVKFTSFEEFFAHVGPRPSPQHSIDRYPDNNGHYEAGNVRWATAKQQANNRRTAKPRKKHCGTISLWR